MQTVIILAERMNRKGAMTAGWRRRNEHTVFPPHVLVSISLQGKGNEK